jgi:hypothetical protein
LGLEFLMIISSLLSCRPTRIFFVHLHSHVWRWCNTPVGGRVMKCLTFFRLLLIQSHHLWHPHKLSHELDLLMFWFQSYIFHAQRPHAHSLLAPVF